jgi:hypothetical protein
MAGAVQAWQSAGSKTPWPKYALWQSWIPFWQAMAL